MAGIAQGLGGSWTHSFEEDTASEHVFRPTASYAFPPSRRQRETLDFDAAQMKSATAGPDDKLQHSATPVTPLGMQRYRLGDGRELEVVEARGDLLRVKMV